MAPSTSRLATIDTNLHIPNVNFKLEFLLYCSFGRGDNSGRQALLSLSENVFVFARLQVFILKNSIYKDFQR